jgi:hypothetical protein
MAGLFFAAFLAMPLANSSHRSFNPSFVLYHHPIAARIWISNGPAIGINHNDVPGKIGKPSSF